MEEEIDTPHKAVVDASFVLSLLLPDEKRKKQARQILGLYQEGKIEFFAPELLKFEVTNGLRSAVKSQRLTTSQAQKLVQIFMELEIKYVPVNLSATLTLALNNDLSVYDASYLILTRNLKLPLLTLDENLQKLAK